ncbi:penicillin-binding protein 2A [Desulfotomaculum arcticum]|uniref:Penicillin-binding protein 1A n=1 Tax=Desulfotruncus arcticus DSM 17038 TaxID=1121424 RepID=A0A1I2V9N9_9FIRM|nr:PBP1A family penicillin-binding protein [Desulfotruncus arcticus]SFG84907.1 penicillin-binding protein 2A [Desulfotomaculum arcticum] [Desulfotruncus arcticus DSM 17038]
MDKKTDAAHAPNPSTRVKKKRRILIILACLFAGMIAAVITLGCIFFYTELFFPRPAFNSTMFILPATTIVYDYRGRVAAELHGPQHRIPVKLEELPPYLVHAVLAAEDARFYKHPGFDIRAMVRAAVANLRAGEIEEGASTVTQQLARNIFLTADQTWERKFKEIYLAFHLERQLEKDAILEYYLNSIYFGDGAYGIEAAARNYFNKGSTELGVNESATLAGLICNPGIYSPFRNPQQAWHRRNIVLQRMVRYGWLDAGRYSELRQRPLATSADGRPADNYPHPFFLDQVIDEASRVHGIRAEEIYNGGLRIYTTLHPEIQALAERVFTDASLFPAGSGDRLVEAALAAVDPQTGYVLALVGGREYGSRRGFNRATMMKRAPGSALKPLVVYAPALEAGWSTEALLPDRPLIINDYTPRNYDRSFRGEVTMNQAVAWSINVPAVWLLNEIGVTRGIETLKKLGLPLHGNDRNLSLALGGMTTGISPLELAGGYAALANGGCRVEPRTIIQIYDRQNRPLVGEQFHRPVFKKSTCQDMTKLLRAVVMYGTGKGAGLYVPVAGKTGTTEQVKGSGNRDAWFAGYTPEVAAAVWMGYDHPDAGYALGFSGGDYPARLFREFVSGALEELPARESDLFVGQPAYPAPPPKPEPPPPVEEEPEMAAGQTAEQAEEGVQIEEPDSAAVP